MNAIAIEFDFMHIASAARHRAPQRGKRRHDETGKRADFVPGSTRTKKWDVERGRGDATRDMRGLAVAQAHY